MATNHVRKARLDPILEHYPAPFAGILSLGEPADETDYGRLAAQLTDYVPDLVRMVLDDDLNNRGGDDAAMWAPLHALRILSILAPAEAVEPILVCLASEDDWYHDEVPKFYGQVGPVALPLLVAYMEDPAHDRFARSSAARALVAIAQAHPQAEPEVVELLVDFLDRPTADASTDEEAASTSVIVALADLKASTAYEAIRRAYEQDRVDTQVVLLEDVERDFGMLPPRDWSVPPQARQESGVRLVLRCKVCGRERQHLFPKVYYDRDTALDKKKRTKYDPLVIPQQVTCPKCGAVDQYELGGMGHIAVLASMMASAEPKLGEFLHEDQQIQFMTFTTRWGPMHPEEAVERYQTELARQPRDAELRVGFGNVLKLLGRNEQSMAEYQRAIEVDPHTHDAWIGLAQLASRRRDQAEAIRCWEKVGELAKRSDLPFDQQILLASAADEGLADLRSGVFPEEELPMTPVTPATPATPATPPPPRIVTAPQPKVGRNDPCPCGSGKKYKHCHGRR